MKKKILSLLLASVFVFAAGCGKKKEQSPSDGASLPSQTEASGHHVDNSAESGEYFMNNGGCDYKLVIPANYKEHEFGAADEFSTFFGEATGLTLPVITDAEVTDAQSGKYVFFGDTAVTEAQGLAASDEYGYGGFEIKTIGDDVYVYGAQHKGVLNGSYYLLSKMIGFDFFNLDTFFVEKGLKSIPLLNYDVSEIPDIQFNEVDYGWLTNDKLTTRRLRILDDIGNVAGATGHNSFEILPLATYLDAEGHPDTYHPKWYSSAQNPRQLCFTAHGDEAELEQMAQASFEFFKGKLMADRTGTRFTFGNQDNSSTCECDSCMAEYRKYGTHAAQFIKFVNRVAVKLQEWLESDEGKEYDRDNLELSILAYLAVKDAPVITVDGKYQPADESIIPEKLVTIMLAYLGPSYVVPLSDAENAAIYDSILRWCSIVEHPDFYWYYTNYHYFLAPYNGFDSIQENYKIAKNLGFRKVKVLAQHTQAGHSTGYCALFAYLCGKLGWDVNADVDALTQKFFKYYFEDAADIMYRQFSEYRSWSLHIQQDFGKSGYTGSFTNPLNKDFWPIQLLETWMEYCEEALASIERYRIADPEHYQLLYDHITCERISIWYLYVNIYADQIPVERLEALQVELEQDFQRLGMSKHDKE